MVTVFRSTLLILDMLCVSLTAYISPNLRHTGNELLPHSGIRSIRRSVLRAVHAVFLVEHLRAQVVLNARPKACGCDVAPGLGTCSRHCYPVRCAGARVGTLIRPSSDGNGQPWSKGWQAKGDSTMAEVATTTVHQGAALARCGTVRGLDAAMCRSTTPIRRHLDRSLAVAADPCEVCQLFET